jgi:hypothetical protein
MRVVAIMVVAALVIGAGASLVLAQQGSKGGPGPGMQRGMQQEVTPVQFPEFKAQALKNIDERMKRMGEHKACIEKAQTHEEMKKCRPAPPMGGQMHRGPGPQRPPQTGGEGGR